MSEIGKWDGCRVHGFDCLICGKAAAFEEDILNNEISNLRKQLSERDELLTAIIWGYNKFPPEGFKYWIKNKIQYDPRWPSDTTAAGESK